MRSPATDEAPAAWQKANAGALVPASEAYPGTVAQWILPGGPDAVSDDMFADMWPTPAAKDIFFVPVVRNGRVSDEFIVRRDGAPDDLWSVQYSGGKTVRTLAAATIELRRRLGPQTEVRSVVLVPSGLVFAIGDNGKCEAAIFLDYCAQGAGIDYELFWDRWIEPGGWYSPGDVRSLLASSPPNDRGVAIAAVVVIVIVAVAIWVLLRYRDGRATRILITAPGLAAPVYMLVQWIPEGGWPFPSTEDAGLYLGATAGILVLLLPPLLVGLPSRLGWRSAVPSLVIQTPALLVALAFLANGNEAARPYLLGLIYVPVLLFVRLITRTATAEKKPREVSGT